MGELTVIQKQEVARGAQAIGAIAGRYARRKSEKITSPLATLSFWGKALSVISVAVAISCIGLAALDASRMNVDRSQKAVVARETVNLRQSPSTGAAVLAKVHYGDRFDIAASSNGWTKVRTSDGKVTGWISSVLLDTRTVRTFVIKYEMKGYLTAFLISLAVVFFALRMKGLSGPESNRNPNETMLIEENG